MDWYAIPVINVLHHRCWKRHGAKWLRALSHYWQACRAAWSRLKDRWTPAPCPDKERCRSDVEAVPVDPAVLGRVLLSRLDPEATAAITAAVRQELREAVHAQAVIEARTELEAEFSRRREALLDRLAQDKRVIEDDCEAVINAKIEAAMKAEEETWADRVDEGRTRLRDYRERASVAEEMVMAPVSQLVGGCNKPPTYLYSGGRGLTALDLGATNAILAQVGLRLRSESSPSPRVVACKLSDGRVLSRTRFWLTEVPASGVEDEEPDEAAEDAADEATAPSLALPGA